MTVEESPGRYRTALSALGETDLTGKVAVVTGANQGIGFITAQALVKGGAKVISACRDMEAAKASAHSIHGSGSVVVKKLDLGDLATVDALVQDLLKEERIDLVICNAGIMMTPCWSTKDGFEAQMGTNHYGHFALVTGLLGKLKGQSFPSRIIVLTSNLHEQGNLDVDDLHFKKRAYDANAAYANSKLANILFVKELARRLQGSKVTAVAVHPGVIPTQLSRHLGFSGAIFRWGLGSLLYSSEWKTPEQGAATTIYAAVSAEIEKHPGAYLKDCAVHPTSNPQAEDLDLAARLWARTEQDINEAKANRVAEGGGGATSKK